MRKATVGGTDTPFLQGIHRFVKVDAPFFKTSAMHAARGDRPDGFVKKADAGKPSVRMAMASEAYRNLRAVVFDVFRRFSGKSVQEWGNVCYTESGNTINRLFAASIERSGFDSLDSAKTRYERKTSSCRESLVLIGRDAISKRAGARKAHRH